MKKLFYFALVALAAISSVSCGKKYHADLHSEVDTFSYAVGLTNGQQIKPFLAQQGVDTAYVADFIRGFNDGIKAGDDQKKNAYYAGIEMGMRMGNGINKQIFCNDENYKLSRKNIVAGLVDGIKGNKEVMDPEAIMPQMDLMAKNIRAKAMERKYGSNKEKGEKFLAENAKKEGVKTLPSGLQYKVIKEGEGALPTDTARVRINYEGKTIDGNIFDSSYKRGEPVEMMVRQNIKGFAEALTHMPVGSTWEIYIPADLAYGDNDMGQIEPYSTLIFKVELLDIVK